MAAPSETYVDPSIAGDSGTGTIGDPYGDLQYALDTMTRDATNGDRINIQDSADEVLTAALDFTTYGTPTEAAPLILQGYTTSAGDGGIGGISGNGSYAIIDAVALDWIMLADLHLHNCGSTYIVRLDNDNHAYGVEFDNTSSNAWDVDLRCTLTNSYIHNIGGLGTQLADGNLVAYCHFENGTNDFNYALQFGGQGGVAVFNIIDIDGSSGGINLGSRANQAINNSIYSNGGTGNGINCAGFSGYIILGNIIEGFSGVGGTGINSASGNIFVLGYNAFYNNTTDESLSGDEFIDLGNDQALGSSPFADAANDDFTVDTSVQALAYPTANYNGLSVRTYLDIGALQRQEAGAGTTAGAGGLNLGHHRLGR